MNPERSLTLHMWQKCCAVAVAMALAFSLSSAGALRAQAAPASQTTAELSLAAAPEPHLSKKAKKAYQAFLAKHKKFKYFAIKPLGQSVVLLTDATFFDQKGWSNKQRYCMSVSVYLYKNGAVKKLGNVATPGSWPLYYNSQKLWYSHNHWSDFVAVVDQKLQHKSFTMWYGQNSTTYKGYNIDGAEFRLDGQIKATGKNAISKFITLSKKHQTMSKLLAKSSFKKNTAKNRKALLG